MTSANNWAAGCARIDDGQITTTSAVDVARLGQRAETMLSELGAISSDPNRLVRLFLTPEHRRAADLVASWMKDAGMTVTEDALGTVRGQLAAGAEEACS